LGSHDQSTFDTTAAQLRHAADELPGGGLAIPEMQLKPPWHVRHARALLAGTGLAALAGLTYGGFYVSQLASDPLGKLMFQRSLPSKPPIEITTPPPPPPPAAAPSPAPRVVAAPAPRPRPAKPAASVEAATRVSPATASVHRPVTHTQPSEAAQIPAAQNTAPGSRACTEAIAALGLCSTAPGGERK
jgi:hypothetical protein